MKLYQFQVGENTRFVYQESKDKYPNLVAAAKDVKKEATDDIAELLKNIKAGSMEGFTLTKKKSGKEIWKNEETGEKIVIGKNGKFRKYKNTKTEEVYKTNRLNDKEAIVKIKTEGKKLKFDKKGALKKAKTEKGGFIKLNEDGSSKKLRNFSKENTLKELEEMEKIVREKTPQDQKKSTTKSNNSEQSETTSGNQYVIQSGDTLSNIAALCKNKDGKILDWNVLYNLNKDALRGGRASLIFPGEKITIPKGYTLNGTTLPAIRANNNRVWGVKTSKTTSPQSSIDIDGDNINITLGGILSLFEALSDVNVTKEQKTEAKKKLNTYLDDESKDSLSIEDANKIAEHVEDPTILEKIAKRILLEINVQSLTGEETKEELGTKKGTVTKQLQDVTKFLEKYGEHLEEDIKEVIKKTKENLKKNLTRIDEAIKILETPPKADFEITGLGKLENLIEQKKLLETLSGITTQFKGKSDINTPFFIKEDADDNHLYFRVDENTEESAAEFATLNNQAPSWFRQYANSKSGMKAIANYFNNHLPAILGHNCWKKEVTEA